MFEIFLEDQTPIISKCDWHFWFGDASTLPVWTNELIDGGPNWNEIYQIRASCNGKWVATDSTTFLT